MSRISIKPTFSFLFYEAKKMSTPLKWIFSLICTVYIIYKITYSQQGLSEWLVLGHQKTIGLFLVAALMPMNWLLEGLKWKTLLAKQEQMSLNEATKSVLIGVASGIFTPNRVGEFAGKIISLKNTAPIIGIKLNLLAGAAQLLATLFFGTVALFFIQEIAINKSVLILFSILLIAIAAYVYCNSKGLFNVINKISGNKIGSSENELPEQRTLFLILLLSFIRYAVFCTQFVLLLYFSGIQLPLILLAGLVSITFLIGTIIPTFALSEIAVRGSVAVFIIGAFSNQEAIILFASFLLWIINIALPALLGCFYFVRLKQLGNTSPKQDDAI